MQESNIVSVSVQVCTFSCVSVYLPRDKEMDIYISSWLHFPELSLMAFCSGAVLLLPTYFMTSCAPHATVRLLNNSTSPLSSVQRLSSLTLSACFSLTLSYFVCSACAEYVGQDEIPQAAVDWTPLKKVVWPNCSQIGKCCTTEWLV